MISYPGKIGDGATHITTGMIRDPGLPKKIRGLVLRCIRRFVNGEALVRDEDGWLVIDMTGKEIHRADPPDDEYLVSGIVRFIGTESPIPTILKMTEWDAAVVLVRHAERKTRRGRR